MEIVEFLINGVVVGFIYALVAVGFALVYGTTRIFHLAHGAVYTAAGYALYVFLKVLRLSVAPAIGLCLAFSAALGVAIEWAVYRPLRRRGAGPAPYFIASLGLFVVLQSLVSLLFGNENIVFREGPLETIPLGPLRIPTLHLVVVAVGVLAFLGLQGFLGRTRSGKALRSLADNPTLTAVFGANVDRLLLLVFGLGSALAGLAALLLAFDVGMNPGGGLSITLIAIVATIIGGVGFLPGAALGGLILGLAQNLSVWQWSAQWQSTVVFLCFIVFLVFRPEGIGGRGRAG